MKLRLCCAEEHDPHLAFLPLPGWSRAYPIPTATPPRARCLPDCLLDLVPCALDLLTQTLFDGVSFVHSLWNWNSGLGDWGHICRNQDEAGESNDTPNALELVTSAAPSFKDVLQIWPLKGRFHFRFRVPDPVDGFVWQVRFRLVPYNLTQQACQLPYHMKFNDNLTRVHSGSLSNYTGLSWSRGPAASR